MKTKPTDLAPEGGVYVCQACGKTAKRTLDFSDVSCSISAVLCDVKSLEYEDGRVIKAELLTNQKESKEG